MNQALSEVINRTQKYQQAIIDHIGHLEVPNDKRLELVLHASNLTTEHSVAALGLITDGFIASGIALLRVQFESLVTGIWFLHAASDNWIEKLSEQLTVDTARDANEGLGLTAMLKQLQSHQNSPHHIIQQLNEFKEITWKAMCSFVHCGIHPLSRGSTGYPTELIFNVISNANAMSALNLQLVTIISTSYPNSMQVVRAIHEEFSDILPINKPLVHS